MTFLAGIDGGQTSTTAVIADRGGTIIAYGYAGPADEIGADRHSTRLRDALEGALADALRAANLPYDTRFASIVAGVSGYEGRIFGQAPRMPTDRFVMMHDAPIAHAGAFGGKPGVIVIAGTGSAAFARSANGETRFEGGWGYLFGDEGSAFWIVRNAIHNAAMHADCPSIARLLSFFDLHSLREIVRAFYVGAISRESLASFAPLCVEAARSGDGCACLVQPVQDAARELAQLASRTAFDRNGADDVAFVGGLMAESWFRARVYAAARVAMPEARIVEPLAEPVIGAVMLARQA